MRGECTCCSRQEGEGWPKQGVWGVGGTRLVGVLMGGTATAGFGCSRELIEACRGGASMTTALSACSAVDRTARAGNRGCCRDSWALSEGAVALIGQSGGSCSCALVTMLYSLLAWQDACGCTGMHHINLCLCVQSRQNALFAAGAAAGDDSTSQNLLFVVCLFKWFD